MAAKNPDWSALLFLAIASSLPLFYIWHKNRTANEIVEAVEEAVKPAEEAVHALGGASPLQKNLFEETVRQHFSGWAEGKTTLTLVRTNHLLRDTSVKGDQAAALAAIHEYFRLRHADAKNRVTVVLAVAWQDLTESEAERRWLDQRFEHHREHLAQVNRKLFAENGSPTLSGISQGHLNDCYPLATIGATLQTNPAAVRGMITPADDGSFSVRFGDGERYHVPPLSDGMILLGSRAGKQGMWLNVLETAYGDHRLFGKGPSVELPEDALDWGHPSKVMGVFTGRAGTNLSTQSAHATDAVIRGVIHGGLRQKALVVATTAKAGKIPPGIHTCHCYAILDYDSNTDRVKIWNPWGARYNFTPAGPKGLEHGYEVREGVFHVPIQDIRHVFAWLTYDLHAP